MKRCKILAGIMVGFFFLFPSLGFSEMTKVDPRLAVITRQGVHRPAAGKGIMKSSPNAAEPLVSTLIRFQDTLSGIEANGGRIRSILGDVATVDLPLSAVVPISQLPNILYMEAAKRV